MSPDISPESAALRELGPVWRQLPAPRPSPGVLIIVEIETSSRQHHTINTGIPRHNGSESQQFQEKNEVHEVLLIAIVGSLLNLPKVSLNFWKKMYLYFRYNTQKN